MTKGRTNVHGQANKKSYEQMDERTKTLFLILKADLHSKLKFGKPYILKADFNSKIVFS